ncbi:serine hydrolase domain-containing protein [Phenylobacterium deserti]|uniref:Serine hydrolase n=1 Tax=Phenylobacterium deserti TaxID=1914756 RepID=A0A328AR49_9CAUL|nr:serine hydrolase domain-containing protein [Phenylobacterium deserti]RAK57503.1 serine hydrolase [Phenylobacterium deserti]
MSTATSLGFSPERLQRIERFLQERYLEPGRLPCAQLLVARRGELAYQTSLGKLDLERETPLPSDAVFRIYSMTKPVTSVALMSLVEEGRIALNDPVTRYIPAWEKLGVYASGQTGNFHTTPLAAPMQVVDLLRHTAGLTYGFQEQTPVDAAYRQLKLEHMFGGYDLEGFVDALAELPLEFTPGEAWNYSVATDVVGYLVQTVAGKPLDEVLRERIFEPLKMVDTGFFVREDQRPRFASCYQAKAGGGLELQEPADRSPFLSPPTLLSGGGGLVSTAADYLRFCNMLLRGGELDGARILSPSTVRLMRVNHLPGGRDLTELSRSLFSESTNAGVGFGLGFAVAFEPHRTLLPSSAGEFYWGGMASTGFWIDPVEQVTAVFMTQLMPSSSTQVRRDMRTLVYQALTDPQA